LPELPIRRNNGLGMNPRHSVALQMHERLHQVHSGLQVIKRSDFEFTKDRALLLSFVGRTVGII